MPNHTCPQCGEDFYHRKSARSFCSKDCYTNWQRAHPNVGTFKGGRPHNIEEVGAVRIRTRRNRNDQRAFVKVAEPNVWRLRAVVVYETSIGPIPAGYVVHHKNGDKLDDRATNLVALSRGDHLMEHRPAFEAKRARRAAAARWGKSDLQT